MGSAVDKNTSSAAISADEILDGLRQIIMSAETLTSTFQARLPGMDGASLAPFALQDLARAGRRGLSQVEVARSLRLSPSSATRLIDSLEAHGVVKREPHPNDRRINQVVLTVVGRALIDDLLAEVERRGVEVAGLDRNVLDGFKSQLSQFCSVVNRTGIGTA